MQNKQYFVSGGPGNWVLTNAKTLRGAKNIASRMYQISQHGRLIVAIACNERYEIVATKNGYAAWQNCL